jgi:hypothetical protein
MWYAGLLRLTWWNLRLCVGFLVFATLAVYSRMEYNDYNQSETREVRLVVGWSYLSGNKSSVSEHWRGSFIDLKSGKPFEYELTGALYRRFNKDERPIDMTLDLNPSYWDADRAGWAATYEFLFWISMALAFWFGGKWLFVEDPKNYPNDKWFCL